MRIVSCLFLASSLLAQRPPMLRGPWLGQTPPGTEARLFAPGFVSTGLYTRDLAMTPDGKEFYFSITLGRFRLTKILVTRQQPDGSWSEPEVATFCAPGSKDLEPHISPDGRRFLFISDRPDPAHGRTGKNFDVWIMDRTAEGWSAPRNLGEPVNTEQEEFFPSLALDGTLYFTRRPKGGDDDIYCARPDGKGGFLAPRKLPPQVNSGQARFNACVSPDGGILVFCAMGARSMLGTVDYFACFRKKDDGWTQPVNLGSALNGPDWEASSASFSPDGHYLFFASARLRQDLERPGGPLKLSELLKVHTSVENGQSDLYWVSASMLEGLRPKEP